MRPAHAIAAILVVAACEPGPDRVAWDFVFDDPTLGARVAIVDGEIRRGGCADDAEVIFRTSAVPGETPTGDAPPLPPGRYGLHGRARDATCRFFASGCVEVDLPAGDGVVVSIPLTAAPERAACPVGACTDGRCRDEAIVDVSTGRAHSCAVQANGEVLCWGRNEEGALGNGTTTQSLTAVAVRDLTAASAISVNGNSIGWQSFSCAIVAPDSVYCWGFNQFGQLGNGSLADSTVPIRVFGVTAPASLTAGNLHACVVRLLDGGVLCWGANNRGQLGNGTIQNSSSPVEATVTAITQVSAGHEHTCSRDQAGRVRCWGSNDEGQLGDGTTNDSPDPLSVAGTGRVMDVAAGGFHTCVIREFDAPGTVYCWGRNDGGQLGDGTTTQRPSPVRVMGLDDARQISAGAGHTCARRDGGQVLCWGGNSHGQLGRGEIGNSSVPVPVLGLDDGTDVSSGHTQSCAVRSTGQVLCWGRNQFGRLGDGTTEDRFEPVLVVGVGG